jgi:hypothetical protein
MPPGCRGKKIILGVVGNINIPNITNENLRMK